MLFRDIKPNYPVYFLDKDNVTAYEGKVVSTSVPRYIPTQTSLVVDITIEANGATHTYTIPESSTLTYANNVVLSTDKDGILREVQAMKSASEHHLSETEHHREIVDSCNRLLEEIDTTFAEKRKQDKRIEGIETEVKNLGTLVREFINQYKERT